MFELVVNTLENELEEMENSRRIETIQTTVLLTSAKILRIILKTWEDLPSLRFKLKTTGLISCKKITRFKNTNNNNNDNCNNENNDNNIYNKNNLTLQENWKSIEHESGDDSNYD